MLHAIVLIFQTTASPRKTHEINFDLEIDRAYYNSGNEESLAVSTPAKQNRSSEERTFSRLSEAAFRGAAETVERILEVEKGRENRLQEGLAGFSALHFASSGDTEGHARSVALLLRHGAKPNLKERLAHRTPLHIAAASGNAEVIQALLEGGADPSAILKDGSTMYHILSSDPEKLVLIDRDSVDVNILNRRGRTALAEAAARGIFESVRILLDMGALVNVASHEKSTALYLALDGGHEDISLLLVRSNALLHASASGHTETIKLLSALGRELKVDHRERIIRFAGGGGGGGDGDDDDDELRAAVLKLLP